MLLSGVPTAELLKNFDCQKYFLFRSRPPYRFVHREVELLKEQIHNPKSQIGKRSNRAPPRSTSIWIRPSKDRFPDCLISYGQILKEELQKKKKLFKIFRLFENSLY